VTTLREAVRAARVAVITEALRECGGNVSGAARSLGIARSHLYRLMLRMEIDPRG
jgi:DNA-binding NtrC family response regulator